MKLLTTFTAVCVCLTAYTSVALAAEATAATEPSDPSLTGILPAEQGSGSSAAGDASEAASDKETSSGRSEPASRGREAKNAIYVDLLGPGLFYSLNYDREIVHDLSARIGFSYMSVGARASDGDGTTTSGNFSYFAVPLTVSYLGIGSENNMFEVGGGGVLISAKGEGVVDGGSDTAAGEAESDTLLALTALAGYRHPPADGGFVFRIGASPMVAFGSGFLPWGYLSLGAAF